MKITRCNFDGLIVLEPPTFKDDRGHFTEAYNYEVLRKSGIDIRFVQDNQSFSKAGVIRGLHFQNHPKAQTKLVRVLHGVIWDVVVDLRRDQTTFRMIHCIELSKENGKQLLVPKGFAHGFSVLSEVAEVLYKCDELYSPEHESGISIEDPELKIDWRVAPAARIVSMKDKVLPSLEKAKLVFE
jgi:dTDP-4-dehydrorhamnose 3,5-epimerase